MGFFQNFPNKLIAHRQYSSDPLIKEEANMIEGQYSGYFKYKKYTGLGRKN